MKIKESIGRLSIPFVVLAVLCVPTVAQATPVAWALDAPHMKKPISGTFQFEVDQGLIDDFRSGNDLPGIIERFVYAIGRSSLLMTMGVNARGWLSVQDLPIRFTLPESGFPAVETLELAPDPQADPGAGGSAVPLPATLTLLGLGMAGIGFWRRKSVPQG